jgi:hypothetical protein
VTAVCAPILARALDARERNFDANGNRYVADANEADANARY